MIIFGCFRLLAGAQFFGSRAVMIIRGGSLLSVSLINGPQAALNPSDDEPSLLRAEIGRAHV